jgi:hypothetical protein
MVARTRHTSAGWKRYIPLIHDASVDRQQHLAQQKSVLFDRVNGSARRASNGVAAPSSLPSSSSLPRSPLPPRDAPAAAPAHTA